MLSRIFIIGFILISFYAVSYSTEKDSTVENIFNLIYNQQFTEAEKVLNDNKSKVEPFYFNILNLDLFWWRYSLSRSKEDANNLNEVLNNFSNSSANKTENQIDRLIRTSYQMRYEMKRYNIIGVLFIRSDVRKQIEDLKDEDLSFLGDRQKLYDFYLALFDYFDESINPFSFGKKSEKYSKSILTLEKFSNDNDLILSTLAHYFLGRIYLKVEKQTEKGQAHFKILANRFPENKLFYQLANGLNTKF
jgi:hypothetical protein